MIAPSGITRLDVSCFDFFSLAFSGHSAPPGCVYSSLSKRISINIYLGVVIIKPSDEALAVKKAYQNGPKYSSDIILPFDEAFSSDAPAVHPIQG